MASEPRITYKQVCPKCGRNDVDEGGPVEIYGNHAIQGVKCTCGCYYYEVYEYCQTECYEMEG